MKDSAKKESAAVKESLMEMRAELESINEKVETVSNSVSLLRNELDSQMASLGNEITELSSSMFLVRQESFNLKMSLDTVNNSLLKTQVDFEITQEMIKSNNESSSVTMPRKVGIFWDQQNVRIPKKYLMYPGRFLNFLRNYFAEPGFEVTEYCAVMDFDHENKKLKNILSEFLSAIHVNGKAKNSEDKKIEKLMLQYRRNVGPDCTLVLITGDAGFIKVVEVLKKLRAQVILVHKDNCSNDLKKKANQAIRFNSILEDLDDIKMTKEEIELYQESSDSESEDVEFNEPMMIAEPDEIVDKRPREETQRPWEVHDLTKKIRVSSPVRMNIGSSQFLFPEQLESKHVISKRAEIDFVCKDFLYKFMLLCDLDEYDEEKNPTGYINMGTAMNNMNADIVHPKISDDKIWDNTALIQYKKGRGIVRLQEALASLMTEMLKTHEPVDPENLYCTVGGTSLIDVLTHCIADPGDVIMTPTPVYERIYTDMLQRALVKMWPIPVICEENDEDQPRLTLDKVKDSYLKAVQSKENVRGIMLLNPNNPLGEVYTPELVKSILEFCNEHQLHAIIDEEYALSVFEEEVNFQSVLAFEHVPDPERTHVLYGLSKDFTLTGSRIGVIHSKCKDLRSCLIQMSFFQNIPFPVMGTKFLEDLEWCKNFVKTNQSRLRKEFDSCKERLMEMNLPVWESNSGFFLWVNFREQCNISTFEDEIKFFKYLIKSFHLYIVPGKELFCAQPGWFRISFPVSPLHVAAGFDRLKLAVERKDMFS